MGNDPIITVRGEATVSAAPDLATVWWASVTETTTAEDARGEVAKHMAMAQSVLDDYAYAIESTSQQIHVEPRIRWRKVRSINDGYTARCQVTLVLKDFETVAQLVSELLSIPGSSISGPTWALRPNSSPQRQARILAIRDAHEVAIDYADAFGVQIERLVSISDTDNVRAAPMMAMRMGGTNEEEFDLHLVPQMQEVRAEVTVQFTTGTPDLQKPSLRN